MRVAIYYTPEPASEFHRLGAEWLGRDAFTGTPARAPDARLDPIVAEPARYGLHATLRAPFRLKPGIDPESVAEALRAFCETRTAPVIGQLALARLGAFFALVPERPEAAIAGLEADVLTACEPYRASPDEAEIARRRPERLSERQRAHLGRWGYPFVLDEFRFHITLTGPQPEPAEALRCELGQRFAAVIGRPLRLDGLAVFVEPEPGAPFRVLAFRPFGSEPVPHVVALP